jgi:glycosyltransferase involved in cell wall biosynthesis
MISLTRVALVGNYLPRRCGIATFTHDLHRAISTSGPNVETCVVAMTDHGRSYDYPAAVQFQIHDETLDEYVSAAEFLNREQFDVVSLQHEFGIFGGDAGSHITTLLSRLSVPIVTTLHTILPAPTKIQRDIIHTIVDESAKVVVMAEKGHELLRSVYRVPPEKIEVIPHGIPDVPFLDTHIAKAKLGFSGKNVILTFGLLSPNKGIETVIDAMPSILASCPDAVYVVLGATHPNLVQQHGEIYREALAARVRELGIDDHVVFFNQFVDQTTLLEFISMCDVYVTPYLNESQMTSGTLAYSFGLGKAVVSTPYWHARELLADSRGVLVPFADVKAIGMEIAGLLSNDVRRHAMRKRAYAASRSMTWAQTAKRYLAVFAEARAGVRPAAAVRFEPEAAWRGGHPIPEISIGHFRSMCDSTGLLQHAVHSVADRSHGYCIDDNARALIFACALGNPGEVRLPEKLTARFAAFVQHAWNRDTHRFRNFMSYERRWLEESGSEDSHGRTLWALGECVRSDTSASRRQWAASLFEMALPAVEEFRSPRAWAFTLLGLDAYCAAGARGPAVINRRTLLADRLMSLLARVQTPDWVWLEDGLAYDNARLPQALILTGLATNIPSYIEAGLRSLRWLMTLQTSPAGFFRPVGTESFGLNRKPPKMFDQQPVEAAATISACLAAWRVNSDSEWADGAMRAFGWFLGDNDLTLRLVDPATGGCSDGLHPDRASENQGAESVLSYLIGLTEIRKFLRAGMKADRAEATSKLAVGA